MPICKTLGVTLSRYDYSETSQVIMFFTRDYGKVRLIAKGSKRPKSNLEGPYDLLTVYEIVFYARVRGSGLQTLAESKLLEDFRALRADFACAAFACYACELVSELCPEGEPNPRVFDLFVSTLRRLAEGARREITVARFELQLYRHLGYLPELTQCAVCRRSLRGCRVLRFSALKGGVLCAKCAPQDEGATALSAAALSAMRLLVAPESSAAGRLRLRPETVRDIRVALDAFIRSLLEHEPRSMRFIQPEALSPKRSS